MKIQNEDNLIDLFLNNRTATDNYLWDGELQQRYPLITPTIAAKMVGNPRVSPNSNRRLVQKFIDDQQLLYDILFDRDLTEAHYSAVYRSV